ncbi:rhomboid family intramembrane serine protease [Pseudolysinimonas sp.]|uniref:rhomboid family intramembrane serine protease n=1 Tax=Pseudolysinimonas sp. TaxID=2680009 RepID=UPI003F81E3F8
MSGAGAEADASVCYRHPDRTSWTLCERCGRTICPECQILTPQGVRCPTCIEELGGSVQWTPAAGPRPQPAKPKRVRARRTTALDDRPGWQRALLGMLRPGDSTPVLSWAAAGITLVIWIVGLFTTVPYLLLALDPRVAPVWQIWRFVTTDFVYTGLGFAPILSLLLGIVFLLLNGPMIERQLGRPRFAALFLVSGATGAAWMAIAGQPETGLFTPIFGLLGCYLVMAWSVPQARTQMLVMLGVLLVLNLVTYPFGILAIVGAFGAGIGSMMLFRLFEDRRAKPSTPYLIMVGGAAFFVAIAIIRQLATGL